MTGKRYVRSSENNRRRLQRGWSGSGIRRDAAAGLVRQSAFAVRRVLAARPEIVRHSGTFGPSLVASENEDDRRPANFRW
jgi:hypothetical protein